MAASTRKTSFVWNFFTVSENDDSEAMCDICCKLISRGRRGVGVAYTTSAMIRHLSVVHNKTAPPPEPDETQGTGTLRQETLEESFSKRNAYSSSDPIAQSITDKIANLIAGRFLPFSFVESLEFHDLMKTVKPRYRIPTRKTFSNTVLPSKYDKLQIDIVKLIKTSVGDVCATTDVWTSRENTSFISITVHVITFDEDKLKLTNVVLACKDLNGPHTADNLLEEITCQEQKWDVKFSTIVSDNGANVVKALALGGYVNVRCMAHTINIIISSALKNSQRSLNDALTELRKIVGSFNKSSTRNERLKLYQQGHGMTVHKLVQEVKTRWNSTYLMICRAIEQKEALNYLASSEGICATLSFNQWRLIEALKNVLEPFEVATRELCRDESSNAIIIPMILNLGDEIKEFRNKNSSGELYGVGTFLDTLDKLFWDKFSFPQECEAPRTRNKCYFVDYSTYEYCMLATTLDPRFKLAHVTDPLEKNKFQCSVEQKVLQFWRQNHHRPEFGRSANANDSNTTATSDRRNSVLFRATISPAENTEDQAIENIKSTISQYINSPVANPTSCPINFWLRYKEVCFALYKTALRHLCCPPTSVCSERLFSASGLVVSPLRNRIKPKNVEMLTLLHTNMAKVSKHKQ